MWKIERYTTFKDFESREDAEKFAKEHGLGVCDELSVLLKLGFLLVLYTFIGYGVRGVFG